MTPSGLSLLGLVKHLGETEYHWFCQTFGRETEPLPMDADDYHDDDPWITDDDTTDSVLGFYARARAAADEVIADLSLDAIGSTWSGKPIALRASLIELIEETARHAGHADILRELLDTTVGDHNRDA